MRGTGAFLGPTVLHLITIAAAQKATITDVKVPIPGGEAGHTVVAVEAAGCYAPGGRYPLPSTVHAHAHARRREVYYCVRQASHGDDA